MNSNQRSEEIVAVLRQALDALEDWNAPAEYMDGVRPDEEIITSLRAAIASYSQAIARAEGTLEAEKANERSEVEPAAWMYPDALCDRNCLYLCTKGFTQFPECATTSQQQNPLTDEQLKPHIQIAMKYYGYDETKYGLTTTSGFVWLARAIEAAHGIKGEA